MKRKRDEIALTLSHRNGRGDWFGLSYSRSLFCGRGKGEGPVFGRTLISKERTRTGISRRETTSLPCRFEINIAALDIRLHQLDTNSVSDIQSFKSAHDFSFDRQL